MVATFVISTKGIKRICNVCRTGRGRGGYYLMWLTFDRYQNMGPTENRFSLCNVLEDGKAKFFCTNPQVDKCTIVVIVEPYNSTRVSQILILLGVIHFLLWTRVEDSCLDSYK